MLGCPQTILPTGTPSTLNLVFQLDRNPAVCLFAGLPAQVAGRFETHLGRHGGRGRAFFFSLSLFSLVRSRSLRSPIKSWKPRQHEDKSSSRRTPRGFHRRKAKSPTSHQRRAVALLILYIYFFLFCRVCVRERERKGDAINHHDDALTVYRCILVGSSTFFLLLTYGNR